MATINGLDILNTKFGFIPNSTARNKKGELKYAEVNLTTIFDLTSHPAVREATLNTGDNYPDLNYYVKDSPQYKLQKTKYDSMKNALPRFYIGATFEFDGKAFPCSQDHIKSKTNLMTVDVDAKDNLSIDLNEIRKKVLALPYVFGVFMSVSRKGFYAIIPVQNGDYTTEYYKSIEEIWLHNFGITIDKQASNLTRARIISVNDDWKDWCKWNSSNEIQIFTKRKIETPAKIEVKKHFNNANSSKYNIEDRTHQAIKYAIDNGYYVEGWNAWYHLGCECANFDDGEELFYKASQNGNDKGSYEDSDKLIEKKWKECSPSGIDDNLARKWQGYCKNMYGEKWWKN